MATSALTSAEAPTGSRCPVDIGLEPTEAERRSAGETGNDNPGAKSSLKGLRASLGRRHEAADGGRRISSGREERGGRRGRPGYIKNI